MGSTLLETVSLGKSKSTGGPRSQGELAQDELTLPTEPLASIG